MIRRRRRLPHEGISMACSKGTQPHGGKPSQNQQQPQRTHRENSGGSVQGRKNAQSTKHAVGDAWINNPILPRWRDSSGTDLQARPVALWLQSLALAPKSKVHVRGLLHVLWDFAMWRGDVPTQRNPMEPVTIKGATKWTRPPRSLTVDEFQRFIQHLVEPFRTIGLVCVCFGFASANAWL